MPKRGPGAWRRLRQGPKHERHVPRSRYDVPNAARPLASRAFKRVRSLNVDDEILAVSIEVRKIADAMAGFSRRIRAWGE